MQAHQQTSTSSRPTTATVNNKPTDSNTKPAGNQTSSATVAARNYVVLSATVSTSARPEDYDFLAPFTALNWLGYQLTPRRGGV